MDVGVVAIVGATVERADAVSGHPAWAGSAPIGGTSAVCTAHRGRSTFGGCRTFGCVVFPAFGYGCCSDLTK